MGSENFDRDGSVEAGVLCAINFAHAASAQRRLDFVRTEFRAGSKSHGWAPL